MKMTLSIIGIVLASIAVILLTLNVTTDRRIKTEIVINAKPDKVWAVLMNHEAYPEWNPFIRELSGSSEVGEFLNATIQAEGKDPMNFKPEVLVNRANEEFRWIGKLGVKGVADGEHYFILEAEGDNKTKLIHGESFTGILSGLLMKILGQDTHKGFNSMNEALKIRVESDQKML